MGDDVRKSGETVEPKAFLSGVDRLAEHPTGRPAFQRTRQPFVRLRELIGRLRMDRGARHPPACQAPGCAAPLTEGYYRRADGLTLCPACFRGMQEAGTLGDEV